MNIIKTSNQNINTGVDGGLVYRNSINMDDQMFRLFITLNIFLKWQCPLKSDPWQRFTPPPIFFLKLMQ